MPARADIRKKVRALAARMPGRTPVTRVDFVAGAGAATNIAVSGIALNSVLLQVYEVDFTLSEGTPNTRAWTRADRTSEASITSAGNIQLSTTVTTGKLLCVVWLDKV